eukprot:11575475-Alexandrium_andersonii.AAC.1
MSASLVGSEMCIRDRPTTWPRPQSPAQTAQRSALPAARLPTCRWHRSQPVSYTHLTLPTICSV